MELVADLIENAAEFWPLSAVGKAQARYWLDYQDGKTIPYFYRFLKAKKNSPEAKVAEQQMIDGLLAFTRGMSENGPYFFGDQPGIVDFAFAPFAARIDLLLGHFKAYQLPSDGSDITVGSRRSPRIRLTLQQCRNQIPIRRA